MLHAAYVGADVINHEPWSCSFREKEARSLIRAIWLAPLGTLIAEASSSLRRLVMTLQSILKSIQEFIHVPSGIGDITSVSATAANVCPDEL